MKLRATRAYYYRGHDIKEGDVFNVRKADANDLIERGLAVETLEDGRKVDDGEYTMEAYSRGNYLIKKGAEVIEKVKGKAKAQKRVDELNA